MRYSHNLRLEGFGSEGQERLLNGRLLIVGCGALGSTAAMYAAGSGTGQIGLVDFDTVDISNLQRQVFFREKEAGRKKLTLLAESIRNLNSDCDVEEIEGFFSAKNCDELVVRYDFIIDAADNPATTYLIEDCCRRHGKSYVTAGVSGYHAQLLTHTPGHLHFSDIFPKVEETPELLPCSVGGVFGPLTGMVASLEASEAVKFLSGCGEVMTDRVVRIDLRTNNFSILYC